MAVLEISRSGATAVLTLNRPERRNALDGSLRDALQAAVGQLRDDTEVRSVVLAGAGGHFCAGGDINAMQQSQEQADLGLRTRGRIQALQHWMGALADLEKPVIAAVDGVAFGAGLSLALAADFILAAPGARFCAVFTRIGLVPDAGAMYFLPRRVGLPRAKELVFSAREVGAEEALRIGLVDEVVHDGLMTRALAMAQGFHGAGADAMGIAKNIMNGSFESGRDNIFEREALAQAICRESVFHRQSLLGR